MPSSAEKCTKALSYEPYKALHGPLPLCPLKSKKAHSKSLDYLNLDKMSIQEPADTDMLQYQLQHLTLRGDRMFSRNNSWTMKYNLEFRTSLWLVFCCKNLLSYCTWLSTLSVVQAKCYQKVIYFNRILTMYCVMNAGEKISTASSF